MPDHKHVEMISYQVAGIGEDNKPIVVEAKAIQDVPTDGPYPHHGDLEFATFDDFIAEARTRWQQVNVTDECPEQCVAQLATPTTDSQEG